MELFLEPEETELIIKALQNLASDLARVDDAAKVREVLALRKRMVSHFLDTLKKQRKPQPKRKKPYLKHRPTAELIL